MSYRLGVCRQCGEDARLWHGSHICSLCEEHVLALLEQEGRKKKQREPEQEQEEDNDKYPRGRD